jgi:hypothetical protein
MCQTARGVQALAAPGLGARRSRARTPGERLFGKTNFQTVCMTLTASLHRVMRHFRDDWLFVAAAPFASYSVQERGLQGQESGEALILESRDPSFPGSSESQEPWSTMALSVRLSARHPRTLLDVISRGVGQGLPAHHVRGSEQDHLRPDRPVIDARRGGGRHEGGDPPIGDGMEESACATTCRGRRQAHFLAGGSVRIGWHARKKGRSPSGERPFSASPCRIMTTFDVRGWGYWTLITVVPVARTVPPSDISIVAVHGPVQVL